jgi:hypothetical protein
MNCLTAFFVEIAVNNEVVYQNKENIIKNKSGRNTIIIR